MKIQSVKYALFTAFLLGQTAYAANIQVNDLSDATGGATCTLRNAIEAANSNAVVGGCSAGDALPTIDTIDFSLVKPGTISLGTGLPKITESVKMDGSVAETRTLPGNPTKRPGVTLDMSGVAGVDKNGPQGLLTFYPNGLYLFGPNASNSEIRGMVIQTRNVEDNRRQLLCWLVEYNPLTATKPDLSLCARGVYIFAANNVKVAGNYFNADADGLVAVGNSRGAIGALDTSHTIIGGYEANDRNVVLQNNLVGQAVGGDMINITSTGWSRVEFSLSGPINTNYNKIVGNHVGVDAQGTGLTPSGSQGISLYSTNWGEEAAIFFDVEGQFGYGLQCNEDQTPCNLDNNLIDSNIVTTSNGFSIILLGTMTNTVVNNNTVYTNVPGFPGAASSYLLVETEPELLPSTAPDRITNLVVTNNRFGVDQFGNETAGFAFDAVNLEGDFQNVLFENNVITTALFSSIFVTEVAPDKLANDAVFTKNKIYGNGQFVNILGFPVDYPSIDLLTVPDFVAFTPNDPLDVDEGANGMQNYPILEYAKLSNNTVCIKGSLNSVPINKYRIEFFANDAAKILPGTVVTVDENGLPVETRDLFSEGKHYLGHKVIQANAKGNKRFKFKAPAHLLEDCVIKDDFANDIEVVAGCITANATLLRRNRSNLELVQTSEFSPAVVVTESDDSSDCE